MNTSLSPTDTPHEATKAPGRRTVDAPVRAFHALFALSFTGAWLTGDSEHWRLVHVTLGYTMIGLLVFRILWGLLGPRHAGLGLLARRLKNLPSLKTLINAKGGGMNWRPGLQWLLAAMMAGLLLVTVPVTLSGYAVYQEWGGEWLEEVHELFGNVFLAFVVAHLALIAWLSRLQRQNLAMPMLTGRRAEAGTDLVKKNHAWLAVLMLVCVGGFWGWQWQQAPVSNAPVEAGQEMDDD